MPVGLDMEAARARAGRLGADPDPVEELLIFASGAAREAISERLKPEE
nr:hypothetical protein 4 [bacterium]